MNQKTPQKLAQIQPKKRAQPSAAQAPHLSKKGGAQKSASATRTARGRISATPKKRRRLKGGILLVIGSLFFLSGVLRIGTHGDALLAYAAKQDDDIPAAAPPETCQNQEGLNLLLTQLKTREAALAKRENAFADRRQALSMAELAYQKNIQALQETEQSLTETMTQARSIAADDVSRLTAVYENMNPDEAVPLFETMAPEFAAGFLGQMRPETAANIMAGLAPEKAYTISVIMAGRNVNVPRN